MKNGGYRETRLNAGDVEHIGGILLGSMFVLMGMAKRSVGGFVYSVVGGALIYRGASGYGRLQKMVGRSASDPVELPVRAVKVERSVFIAVDSERLYRWWRKLDNLPKAMSHLKSVSEHDNVRSHWVAKAPLNTVVEWDAQVVNDVPGQLIAWRSLEGGDVDNAGSVRFKSVEGGTDLQVTLRYLPPGDVVGAVAAKLLGEDPGAQLEQDLIQFKKAAESGGILDGLANPYAS